MLQQTDRLALAVPDAEKSAADLNAIFDSVVIEDSIDNDANARCITLQWGYDQLELFEPIGDGPVAEFINEGKRGIFAGGFALDDPASLAARIESTGIPVTQQGDRYIIYPQDLRGTGVILSPIRENEKVGMNDRIWQITYTVPNLEEGVEFYGELFGLQDALTSYYTSEVWGYRGAITWFHSKKGAGLDSLEFLDPYEHDKAAGRFLAKTGGVGGIYMSCAHADALSAIHERVDATGGGWQPSPNKVSTGFIHPRRTSGLLVAICKYEEFDARRPTPESDAWQHEPSKVPDW